MLNGNTRAGEKTEPCVTKENTDCAVLYAHRGDRHRVCGPVVPLDRWISSSSQSLCGGQDYKHGKGELQRHNAMARVKLLREGRDLDRIRRTCIASKPD